MPYKITASLPYKPHTTLSQTNHCVAPIQITVRLRTCVLDTPSFLPTHLGLDSAIISMVGRQRFVWEGLRQWVAWAAGRDVSGRARTELSTRTVQLLPDGNCSLETAAV